VTLGFAFRLFNRGTHGLLTISKVLSGAETSKRFGKVGKGASRLLPKIGGA
jgi:hypothetical protein